MSSSRVTRRYRARSKSYTSVNWSDPIDYSDSLTRSLESFWRIVPHFSGGTTLRDYAGRNHGTLTNTPTWQVGGYPGGWGTLRYVRVSSQHVVITNGGITAPPMTFSTWFMVTSTGSGNNQTIISLCNSASSEDYFSMEYRGGVGATLDAATRDVVFGRVAAVSSTTISADTWYHGTAVYQSSTSRQIYINGILRGNDTSTCAPSGVDRGGIGRLARLADTDYVDGDIDSTILYSRALTASEVLELYIDSLQGHPRILRRVNRQFPRSPALPADQRKLYIKRTLRPAPFAPGRGR